VGLIVEWGFVRHGSTDWNASGRLQGQTDIELNPTGREQARRLAKRLKGEGWEAVVSSDLKRAYETASIIAAEIAIPAVHIDARLRERTHGRLDGTTMAERIAKWGEGWKELDHGAESDEQLFARGKLSLDELESLYGASKILIVSHGAFIGTMLNGLLDEMPPGLLQNTALSILRRETDKWNCTLYNCTAHLQ
jgi:probable phosphoglycerate mutase